MTNQAHKRSGRRAVVVGGVAGELLARIRRTRMRAQEVYERHRRRCGCGHFMEGLFSQDGDPMLACFCGAEYYYHGPLQDCIPANERAEEVERAIRAGV